MGLFFSSNGSFNFTTQEFIEKYLLPPNGKSASENIYENMLEEIMKGPKFK
jgi:hypothetical protein